MGITAPVNDSARRRADARMLDTAEGVLIGLRRCSIQTAFAELISVGDHHHTPVLAVARALVELAENPIGPGREVTDGAAAIARQEWAHLFID